MITLIGDAHGKLADYRAITRTCDYSVQLGDMAFNYNHLEGVDPDFHKFFGGNHDNYDHYPTVRHSLGEFGEFELNKTKFFFVRGAFSIDKKYRIEGASWWRNEELTINQCKQALKLYQRIKPDLVLTHDCPTAICDVISNPNILIDYGFDPKTFSTRTQELLQDMLDYHKPSRWFFGHHHKSVQVKYKGCEFQCLNELETLEI